MKHDSLSVAICYHLSVSVCQQSQRIEDYRVYLQDTSKLGIHQVCGDGRVEPVPLLDEVYRLRMTVGAEIPYREDILGRIRNLAHIIIYVGSRIEVPGSRLQSIYRVQDLNIYRWNSSRYGDHLGRRGICELHGRWIAGCAVFRPASYRYLLAHQGAVQGGSGPV